MNNYSKIQAIQGIINDFREKHYFLASTGCKYETTKEDMERESQRTLEVITEIIKHESQ